MNLGNLPSGIYHLQIPFQVGAVNREISIASRILILEKRIKKDRKGLVFHTKEKSLVVLRFDEIPGWFFIIYQSF